MKSCDAFREGISSDYRRFVTVDKTWDIVLLTGNGPTLLLRGEQQTGTSLKEVNKPKRSHTLRNYNYISSKIMSFLLFKSPSWKIQFNITIVLEVNFPNDYDVILEKF